MNLADWVQRHGRRRPDSPAIAHGEDVHATWAELASRTASTAAGLNRDLHAAGGDRVAIVMRNRPEYLEALLAIWHAGLVAVPINSRLHRDEIGYIVQDSGAIAVITDDDHAADVGAVLDAVETLRAVIVAPGEQWDDLARAAPIGPVDRQPTDPAWLFGSVALFDQVSRCSHIRVRIRSDH